MTLNISAPGEGRATVHLEQRGNGNHRKNNLNGAMFVAVQMTDIHEYVLNMHINWFLRYPLPCQLSRSDPQFAHMSWGRVAIYIWVSPG